MSYSIDLRERVIAFIEGGGSKIAASRLFRVSCRTVFMWVKQKKERKDLRIKLRDCKPYKINEAALIAYVKKNPDYYLKQIAAHFHVTAPAIFFALKRLKITLKKKRSSTSSDAKKNVKASLIKQRLYPMKALFLLMKVELTPMFEGRLGVLLGVKK